MGDSIGGGDIGGDAGGEPFVPDDSTSKNDEDKIDLDEEFAAVDPDEKKSDDDASDEPTSDDLPDAGN